MYKNLDTLVERLQRSKFRSSFRLKKKELEYLNDKGFPVILKHGRSFINTRLAPKNPPNDGKQTPFGKHPVFVAQHATGTCCRSCLRKWHKIPKNRELSSTEVDYILSVIEYWLRLEL